MFGDRDAKQITMETSQDNKIGCNVYGCKNKYVKMRKTNSVALPRKKETFSEWLKLIGRPDLAELRGKSLRICTAHFDPSDIRARKSNKNAVDPNAKPCRALPGKSKRSQPMPMHNETELCHIEDSEHSQSDETLPSQDLQAKEIADLEKEIATIFTKSTSTIRNDEVIYQFTTVATFKAKFSNWQSIIRKKYGKYQCLRKLKLFCLNLYCSAPKAYKLFAKCLSLPPPRSLQNMKLRLDIGINDNLLILLTKQLRKMPSNAKYVILCIDEMPLTKHLYYDLRNDEIVGHNNINESKYFEYSENALVIRLKGLVHDYEQVVAYGATGSTYDDNSILNWLDRIFETLFNLGFVICALVAQQNKNTNQIALALGVNIENPFFTANGVLKVYFLFDVPHLFNTFRDLLLDCDLLYDEDKMASWPCVKSFYEKDLQRKIKLAPKVTHAHIKPVRSQRTQVRLMKQVFSYAVAAGVAADVDAGYQPLEAIGTAEFLMIMNNLYDILNSTNDKKHPNKYENAFNGEQYQVDYLLDAITMFQQIRAINNRTGIDCTGEIDCFIGILITIKSVIHLQQYLTTVGIKHLSTRKLQLNTNELLSDFNNTNKSDKLQKMPLTAIQFRRCISKLVLKNIMKNSNIATTGNDLDTMIFGKESLENDFTLLEKYFPNPPKTNPLAVGTTDYRFQMPTVLAFEITCSYLLYKVSGKHNCDTFKEYTSKHKKLITGGFEGVSNMKFMKFIHPPRDFFDYMYECEKWFILNFDYDAIMQQKNMGANLWINLSREELIPFEPCPCFPFDYLKKLFLRLRIYNSIKFKNLKIKKMNTVIDENDPRFKKNV